MSEGEIRHYIMLYGAALNLKGLNEINFNISILDDIDFCNETESMSKDSGDVALKNAPIVWTDTDYGPHIIINQKFFLKGIDKKFGIECLYSILTEIVGEYTGEIRYKKTIIDFFSQHAFQGFLIWKEFYCAQIAVIATSNLYETLQEEGYEDEALKKGVLDRKSVV